MTENLNDYREYLPCLGLRDHFMCLWSQSIHDGDEYVHRVLPDGCIDLVFINDEAPVFVGPWTEPFTVRFTGGSSVIGARWHIGRAPGLLGVAASELRNLSVAMSDVWGDAAHRDFARVTDRFDVASGRSALERALLRRLGRAASVDGLVDASLRWLVAHPSGRITALSRYMGISRRQLQRRFLAAVGYGPKSLHSVLRLQRLLHLATRQAPTTLGRLSVEAGYIDHAHMAHEVQRLAGATPSGLLRSTGCTIGLADYFDARVPNRQDMP